MSHRIVFVGNPPYHEQDGGHGPSSRPIYQNFLEHALEHGTEVLFVIPARWYTGGKGLDGFRNEMLNSGKIKQIVDFPISAAVFPTVEISGGVCFIHAANSHDGTCSFTSKNIATDVNLSLFDVLVREPKAITVIQRVLASHNNGFFDEVVSSRKPFGLATNFARFSTTADATTLTCRTMKGCRPINAAEVVHGLAFIPRWKVITTRAGPGRDGRGAEQRKVLSTVDVLPPQHVCLETYLVVASFETEQEARSCAAFLTRKLPRFLLNPRMTSQDISKEKFAWVPIMDFTRSWADQELYDHFDLTAEEQDHIEATIKP
jgi:site-specific DNA-methyltransferase (adenine-specific)